MIIDLKDFIGKVKAYQSSPYGLESLYQQTLKKRDVWDNLSQIDDRRTKDVILKFLNQWKCRLSYDCTSDLTKTLQASSSLLAKFNKYNLQNIEIDSIIANDNLREVFRRITLVQAGRRTVGATATSKILHMVNPNFFVMSDGNIRAGYGCHDNEMGYVNFMLHMKWLGDAVLQQYSTIRKVSKEFAFQNLVSECNSKASALSKLLDEYNWVKYNPK